MNLTVIKEFAKSKKGISLIAGGIAAAVVFFFPDSKDFIVELLNGVVDKIDPITATAP